MKLELDDQTGEFWPEMPKSTKKRMSKEKSQLLDLVTNCRGVRTSSQIADVLGCPARTVECWRLGTSLPKEWVCRLILEKLKDFC